MAAYHNRLIDGFFIRPFYKMMLNKPIQLQDIEAVDIEYYKSMKFIMDTDDVESLDMTFTTETDVYGQVKMLVYRHIQNQEFEIRIVSVSATVS